jgi:hypothetical protein
VIHGSISYNGYDSDSEAVIDIRASLQYSRDGGSSWTSLEDGRIYTYALAGVSGIRVSDSGEMTFFAKIAGSTISSVADVRFRIVQTYARNGSTSNPRYIATLYNQ